MSSPLVATSSLSHAKRLPPLRRLASIIAPDRGDILAVIVFALITGGFLLATPVAVQTLVNFVAFGSAIPPLLVLSLLLFGALGAGAMFSSVQTWIVELLQRRIFVRLVADLGRRLPRVSRSVADQHYAPELVNRFFDVMTVQKASSVLLLEGLGNLLGIVVGLMVLAFYHPLLLAFDLVLLLVVAIVIFGPMRRGVKTAVAESQAKYAVAGWLEDLARSPLAFRSGGVSEFVDRRSKALAQQYVDSRRRHYRVVFGQVLGTLTLQVVASTALLAIGGFLVISGELTLGQLVAAELIVAVIVQSVAKMGKHLETYYDLMAAVDKLGVLLDLDVEDTADTRVVDSIPEATNRAAVLELSDVSLSIEPGQPLFEGLSVRLESGQALGIQGRSGSGRSSLLELLYGLRNPDRGEVTIDGLEFREVELDELRRKIAIASSVEIFEGTVLENLTLGREDVGVRELTEVLRELDLLESLRRLPDGLQTRLHPGGLPLSEGQRLRLVLARAILTRPRLLLVDGLLDTMSELGRKAAREVLFRKDRPWSLVIVTDREEVLELCDVSIDLTALTAKEREGDSKNPVEDSNDDPKEGAPCSE